MTQSSPLSPITGDSDVAMEFSIDARRLKDMYWKTYGVNIERFLPADCTEVRRYRCLKSGFQFYQPANIVGDSEFYSALQVNDWYYMPEKWEFEEALKSIPKKRAANVLEIGSAKGDFLAKVAAVNREATVTGLELNRIAAEEARARGLNVLTETLEHHAEGHAGEYDVVASFQVLEHVPDPMSLLRDAIRLLRPDGRLIIGVPDNSQRACASIFVKEDADLNMPPHHQGLWSIPSLAYLTKVLPLQIEHLALEPATSRHHWTSYRHLVKTDLRQKWGPVLGTILYAVGRPFYNHALTHLCNYLPAHSVLVVYKRAG